jgi:hypothetical protein
MGSEDLIMTPAGKARYLIYKYNLIVLDTALGGSNDRVKKCALIAVDQIINIGWNLPHYNQQTGIEYWNEVKQEIQKL